MKKNEVGKIFGGIGYGAMFGGGLIVILFVYSFFGGAINCLCNAMGKGDLLPMIDKIYAVFVLAISIAIGLVVGICNALCAKTDRILTETAQRHSLNHKNLLKEINSVISIADQKIEATQKALPTFSYEATSLIKDFEATKQECIDKLAVLTELAKENEYDEKDWSEQK